MFKIPNSGRHLPNLDTQLSTQPYITSSFNMHHAKCQKRKACKSAVGNVLKQTLKEFLRESANALNRSAAFESKVFFPSAGSQADSYGQNHHRKKGGHPYLPHTHTCVLFLFLFLFFLLLLLLYPNANPWQNQTQCSDMQWHFTGIWDCSKLWAVGTVGDRGHPMMSGESAGRWQCCAIRRSRYHRPLLAKASHRAWRWKCCENMSTYHMLKKKTQHHKPFLDVYYLHIAYINCLCNLCMFQASWHIAEESQLAHFWSTSPNDQQLRVHKSAAVLKPDPPTSDPRCRNTNETSTLTLIGVL